MQNFHLNSTSQSFSPPHPFGENENVCHIYLGDDVLSSDGKNNLFFFLFTQYQYYYFYLFPTAVIFLKGRLAIIRAHVSSQKLFPASVSFCSPLLMSRDRHWILVFYPCDYDGKRSVNLNHFS